ncbi:PAS domain-containing protein [Mucilaginibacter terrae]|uniref:histidine kinase n=1 Tax=Mucilaginibacter terrae TaxID=1955052 RepID=A0ABU3GPK4_9SPHI|nr:PAS domain-containing protein [Mucilaginibacter terrae]MDT3401714.1 two-component system sensor histidine kinase VicK [Mucilaginibacter terrae]
MTDITRSTITDSALIDVLIQSNQATAIYDSEDLHIRFVNDAMLNIWGKDRSVIGKTFEQAIPEIIGQPFTELLKNVWCTGETYIAKSTAAQLVINGQLTTSYFDFEYRAIINTEGKTYCLLHTATDVTQKLKDWNKIQERFENEQQLTEELTAGNEELRSLNEELSVITQENKTALEQLAMAKQAGGVGLFDLDVPNDHLVWDERCKELFGVSAKQLVTYSSDFVNGLHPDDREQTVQAVNNAFNKALTGGRYNVKYRTVGVDDGLIRWVHAVGQVHFDEQDKPKRFIGTVTDLTDEITARIELEESEIKLQDANEELSAINEEQASINEELRATNEELADTQAQLLNSNSLLLESQNRLRDVLEQAPVGMCVLRGPNHVIEIANEAILNIWGRKREDIINKPHRTARPELEGQPVFDWLDKVYSTGQRQVNREFKVMLRHGDGLRQAIVNSVYEALRDASGAIYGVLIVLEDITEAVKQREEAHRIQEMFNLAIDAGELGAFYYDPQSNQFTGNDILKKWFGVGTDEFIHLDIAINVIADEDRERVTKAITDALNPEYGGVYDIEYTIINPVTQFPRIVKAKGKTTFDAVNRPVSLNGMLLDITERKQDEQRKNDFIGMVSHELKTPLTSVNAYIQMLQGRAVRNEDSFTGGALDKVANQIRKMTVMINGFLNVSRFESGKIHIDKQCFDMASLLKDIEEEYVATTNSHDIIFAPVPDVEVVADRDKIGQVINNLISNAIKYSPQGSAINVDCAVNNGQVKIFVKDQGMGVKPDDQQRLFDRYYRVKGEHMRSISGFGIGLYLCAEIVTRHDGKIWVESEFGNGSTFCFSIPAAN